jgi:hypothetical protein
MSVETKHEAAGKQYGNCSKRVSQYSATPGAPTARESELLIAFGIASDWTRRSAALQPLIYSKCLVNRSSKSPGVSQSMRFTR